MTSPLPNGIFAFDTSLKGYPYDPDAVTLAKNCDVLIVVTPATAESTAEHDIKVSLKQTPSPRLLYHFTTRTAHRASSTSRSVVPPISRL